MANQCSILKSSTLVKCHFGHLLISILLKIYFAKMCSTQFPPFTVKASPKSVCHKMQWLQFANRNTTGLQSWHSSKHFQIPITLAISTLQLRLNIDCNFGLASTTICERGFSKQSGVKSDRSSRLKLETLDALMQVSLYGLLMELIN